MSPVMFPLRSELSWLDWSGGPLVALKFKNIAGTLNFPCITNSHARTLTKGCKGGETSKRARQIYPTNTPKRYSSP